MHLTMKMSVKSFDPQRKAYFLSISFHSPEREKETLEADPIEGDVLSQPGLQLGKGIMSFLRRRTSIEFQIIPAFGITSPGCE